MPRNTNTAARFPAEELDETELAETLEQPAEMPDETDAELADEIVEEEAQEEETLDEETEQIDRPEPEQEMPPRA